MKKVIIIFILLISSSFIICQSTVIYKEETIYKKIGQELNMIEESGIKLQYSTTRDLEQELNRIEKLLDIKLDIYTTENMVKKNYFNHEIDNTKYNIKILLNKEKNRTTSEIEIIDKSNRINIKNIKKKLNKIIDSTIKDEEYFTYTKGKLINGDNIEINNKKLIELIGYSQIKEYSVLPIKSGITGNIVLKNNCKFNYSFMKYNAEIYLIIGTPVIFTTY